MGFSSFMKNIQALVSPLPAGTNVIGKVGIDQTTPGVTNKVVAELQAATPESGTDAVGADAYATVMTPSTTFEHMMISNEGANPVTISIDAGSTDTFIRIPSGVFSFDGVAITATAIQAKNASAGSNYSNLTLTVW